MATHRRDCLSTWHPRRDDVRKASEQARVLCIEKQFYVAARLVTSVCQLRPLSGCMDFELRGKDR
jgi:hypothetical protein